MRLEIALPEAIINRYPNWTCFAFKDTIVLLKKRSLGNNAFSSIKIDD